MKKDTKSRLLLASAATSLLALTCTDAFAQQVCERTIKADVVALDQAFYANRLGALQAGGMMFALRRDVVSIGGPGGAFAPGYVMLRPDKRPRPIVLRMNVGDCIQIQFQNLLGNFPSVFSANAGAQQYPVKLGGSGYTGNQNAKIKQTSQGFFNIIDSQPPTRLAGVHVMGLNLISAEAPPGTPAAPVGADGSWVGANDNNPANVQQLASGLVGPGSRMTYTYKAAAEGAFLLYSTGADVGDQIGFGGQLMQGLFGSVTVQPRTAEWYRSQVTKVDLDLATDGTTADGHPIINYDKVYPSGHPRAGQPILKMLDQNNEIVYTDLTAIITGPRHGRFAACRDCPDFRDNPSYPNQLEPFREFAIHYHDDFVSTQAFEPFRKHLDATTNDPMSYTLQGSRDFFAINYGMAGIGPEVWANRIKVGPMHDCATCRFEEFFLSSWAVGDPAMVVDFPANSVDPGTGAIKTGPKATKALYPDDPSNVYHSYMNDHVKFQILHAGTNISHVHHLHAHQWLHSPNDDQSSYRDSQMISPGGSYTLNHTYNGSGNKNKTVGDAIFHCHFYPHFAQGMWSLWRVHDVFEGGTTLDRQGRPVAGWNRALPDGEIPTGTAIPALVPMPTLPMAPIGARVRIQPVPVPGSPTPAGFRADVDMADPNIANGPGFPFFIPGVAGQRATHPPLDFAPDPSDAANPFLNGGLPRFLALKEVGKLYEKHNRWDFTKFNDRLKAIRLDENGTDVEKIAMKYHATRLHNTFFPDGSAATGASGFVLNGRPPINGAPYADPAVELDGTPVCPDNKPPCLMRYKAADIQLNLTFNKKGQHYPQARMITLWGDVADTLANKRAPEPFFFRTNSTQVIEYWLANLVPNYYELDDFQVRTPTDILGQHIHLVKFDVTASDGAGNGFNYEDGTLSPDEVREVIDNINNGGGLFTGFDLNPATAQTLKAKPIPYFGTGTGNAWLGAQATIQRWYADPVLSNGKSDRTLRTVFTHDHFGPSTHQQVGLYAGLLVEPAESRWQDPVSGVFLGTNLNRPAGADGQAPDDGGPTSWQANIITSDQKESYREFALEFQDRQLGYKAISRSTLTPYTRYAPASPPCTPPSQPWGWADPDNALSRPLNDANTCLFAPFPSIVTLAFQTGGYSLNYRNEPPAFRVNPNIGSPNALQQDLSHVFRSIPRADPALNVQPTGQINSSCAGPACFTFPPAFAGAENNDPYTPLLRAYEGDRVQIRTLVGAHMSPHSFTTHGINWLFEPTDFNPTSNNSGYRGSQGMGISEHYEMLFNLPRTNSRNGSADYLYATSSDVTGLANGNWGLMRAYRSIQEKDLVALPNNKPPSSADAAPRTPAVCAPDAPKRDFSIVAAFAREVLNGPVVYNARGRAGFGGSKQLVNWNALAYFLEEDLDPATGRLLAGKPVEPLILRAAAGDCINITLKNRIPDIALNVGASSLGIPVETSRDAGLHPQLVSFDITDSNGVNVGKNPERTVKPGQQGSFTWYAGKVEQNDAGGVEYVPIEFGSIPLTPSDPLRQHPYGLLGALIVEPKGSSWRTDDNSRASAVVCAGATACTDRNITFREFVAVFQDDVAAIRETVPKYGAPNTITIQGTVLNGKVSWAMNGKALPAAGVVLNPGQIVNFEIGTGTHGLLFNDEASARAVFDIDGSPDKAKFHVFATQCTIANSYGTTPQASGHIATLTVKQAFTLDAIGFMCSQHCQNMPGSFTISLPPTTPPSPNYTRAINYKTEPLDYRYIALDFLSNLDSKVPLGISRALSNSLVQADPQTPIFAAANNMPVRMRLVHPAGTNEQVFTLHGHVWQEEPYVNGSKEIGNNPLSQSQGSRDGFGPNIAFDAAIDRAGGAAGTPGDYLYRTFIGQPFQYGMWGLLRVGEAGKDIVTITRFSNPAVTGGKVLITGTTTVNPATGHMADQVTIFDTSGGATKELGKADIDPLTGRWPKSGDPFAAPATVKAILVRSAGNGEARAGNFLKQAIQSASGVRRDTPDELALFNAMPRRMETILEASGAGPATAQWILNERTPIAPNGTITIRPGDTITVAVRQGTHDLMFPNGALARSVFKFEMPGSSFALLPNAGQGAIGTRALTGGTVLATLTVRTDIPANVNRVTFTSVVDGQRMTATFVIQR